MIGSAAPRARAISFWMTGTSRATDGPQYGARPSWPKSSIMSTTTSARFISGPAPAARARCDGPGAPAPSGAPTPGIGDPPEATVLVLVAISRDVDTLRAQLRNKSVELVDAVVEHERRLARAEIGRVLFED